MTSNHVSKLAATAVLLAAATGCAVPGDPYYSGGYAPTPVYGATTIYESGAYPAYPAYADRDREDRWEDMRNDRERRAWRERQAERERERVQRARDEQARRDLERQRDQRDQWARQQRERDLAQRQREQRSRATRNDRNSDGSPRTDYDRYNPSTGAWMPRSEDMP
ncbi:hypothetical protein [Simplicispira hankyongi]|uniref:hypothetical protein n=1 Tax=Simplicispira hankyongi TaxID=2315688 RepID=UPI0011C47982|nr:hypothetical protein [Simplicispira hankyongi]